MERGGGHAHLRHSQPAPVTGKLQTRRRAIWQSRRTSMRDANHRCCIGVRGLPRREGTSHRAPDTASLVVDTMPHHPAQQSSELLLARPETGESRQARQDSNSRASMQPLVSDLLLGTLKVELVAFRNLILQTDRDSPDWSCCMWLHRSVCTCMYCTALSCKIGTQQWCRRPDSGPPRPNSLAASKYQPCYKNLQWYSLLRHARCERLPHTQSEAFRPRGHASRTFALRFLSAIDAVFTSHRE